MGIIDFKTDINLPWWRSRYRSQAEVIEIIKEAVCYNQSRYIQFEYLVGEKHKALKDELSLKNISEDRLHQCAEELDSYIFGQLKNISRTNFEYITNYLKVGRESTFDPRICIKNYRDGKIVDVIRSEKAAYWKEPYLTHENTGFQHVYENGTFYFENNIPDRAKEGGYVNPRLDIQRVHVYNKNIWQSLRKNRFDVDWCNCWYTTVEDRATPNWQRSCYKSTIIIPMALLNSELDSGFRDKFPVESHLDNRIIWGFLCMDHLTEGYFREEDIKVGYIFADILALHYFSTAIHTNFSRSYLKARKILGNNGLM